jgi:hypothetical protein
MALIPVNAVKALIGDDRTQFEGRAEEESFVLDQTVNPDDFFGWEEENRLLAYSDVERNLLRDGQVTQAATEDQVSHQVPMGATLQLENIERFSPQVAALCGELSAALGGEYVRCNAYMAPSDEDVGFRTHHDTVDAFIVQIRGKKRWTIWEPVIADPVWVMKSHDQDVRESTPYIDRVLEPGEVIFLRRGDPHLARCAGDVPSLHLTIGIHRTNAQDLIEWLLEEAREHARFRRSWPFASRERDHTPEREGFVGSLCQQLGEWLSSLDPSESTAAFLNHRAATAERPAIPALPGLVSPSLTDICCESFIALGHPRLAARISDDALYTNGRIVHLPGAVTAPLRRLIANPTARFSVEELFGESAANDALEVLAELASIGVITVSHTNA